MSKIAAEAAAGEGGKDSGTPGHGTAANTVKSAELLSAAAAASADQHNPQMLSATAVNLPCK